MVSQNRTRFESLALLVEEIEVEDDPLAIQTVKGAMIDAIDDAVNTMKALIVVYATNEMNTINVRTNLMNNAPDVAMYNAMNDVMEDDMNNDMNNTLNDDVNDTEDGTNDATKGDMNNANDDTVNATDEVMNTYIDEDKNAMNTANTVNARNEATTIPLLLLMP